MRYAGCGNSLWNSDHYFVNGQDYWCPACAPSDWTRLADVAAARNATAQPPPKDGEMNVSTEPTDDRRKSLRELATTLRDQYRLPGPWHWSGWLGQDIHLQTRGNGGMYVMGFARYGMQQAQPVFPHLLEGETFTHLVKAMERPRFQVCHEAEDAADPRVYRTTIDGIRNPVAEYLAAVDPDMVLGLLDEIEELRARVDACPNPTSTTVLASYHD